VRSPLKEAMDLRKEDHEPPFDADEVGVEVPEEDMMSG
jgi:hypothetical protein